MPGWLVYWPDKTVSLVFARSKLMAASLLDEVGDALDPCVGWKRWPTAFVTIAKDHSGEFRLEDGSFTDELTREQFEKVEASAVKYEASRLFPISDN